MAQHGPRVRAATVADVPRLAEIDAATFPALPYPEFFFRQAVDAFGGMLRVVETPAGEVAGFALSVLAAGETTGWLMAMAIAKEFRGAGLGAVLVDDASRELLRRGATTLRLTVEPDNVPALRLYQRNGFQPIGRVDDYFGPGGDRVIYQRAL